jgi:hypothetical protein
MAAGRPRASGQTLADVEVSRDRKLRAARLEFAPDPMLSSVMKYLSRLPAAVPPGQILVHNTISSSRRLGSRGFRAWLDKPSETVEPCDCGWLAELGPHYRVKRAGDLTPPSS